MHRRDDFPSIAALFGVSMLVPILVVFAVQDGVSLYLTGRQFTYVVAFAFAVVAWALLAVVGFDRRNFAFASVALPWVFVFLLIPVGIAVRPDAFEYLFWEIEDLGAYAASYTVAGIAAVAVDREVERLGGYEWVPTSRDLSVSLLVVLAVAAVAGGGYLHLTATAASVADTEVGVTDLHQNSIHAHVEGDPTELRLTVVTPDDRSHTERISYSELEGGSTTVTIPFHYLSRQDPQAGTYHIELQTLAGVTVDTATYTIEAPPPSILSVETAPPGETISFEPEPDTARLADSDNETSVGVVVENNAEVGEWAETRVLAGGEEIASWRIFIEPGARGGIALALPEGTVEAVHEDAAGMVTVEVEFMDHRMTEEVALPRR